MTHQHHRIDYVELTVQDLARSTTFYRRAFGWTFNDYGPTYAGIIGADGEEVGGLLVAEPRAAGGPLVIVYSDDLDESATSIVSAGGAITEGPYPFPGGRRLHFTDPDGNELGVWAVDSGLAG